MKKVIALDIGGTNTRVALINEKYEIEAELIYDTVTGSLEGFLERVGKTVEDGVKDFKDVVAIAAGVPGRVRVDGYIDELPNIGIKNVPLREYLEKRFHLPAYIGNDAEVAALAEANVGPHKHFDSLYFVTISTGVGGALTRNGKLVHSSYEAGHTMTLYQDELYEFEHLASGTGLVQLCKKNGLIIDCAKDFFILVKGRDPLAVQIKNDWIALLAGWFNMLQTSFEPSAFALTGGVMKSADFFLDELREACIHCSLQIAGCGQRAGMLGAAVLGFQKVEERNA